MRRTLGELLPHACGMARGVREARFLIMLRAYFDEASDDVKAFLMGGWLATFKEWEKFSDAWDTELKFPPRIEYFNHNEALGEKKQFKGWTNSDIQAKMNSLAGVIARHDVTGIVGGVAIPKINFLFSGSILPKKQLRSVIKFTEPYHFVCQGVIACTLGHQIIIAKNSTDRVDFIFDDGVKFLDDCTTNFSKYKTKFLPLPAQGIAGTILSANDRDVVALQASDMLVGQHLLALRTNTVGEPMRIMRARKVYFFDCLRDYPASIPKAVSRVNVTWSIKRLEKITKKEEEKNENKGRGKR